MRTKILFSTAAALLLASGASAVSGAGATHTQDIRGYEVARYQVEKVQRLAHEVEDRARVVYRSAERLAHHRDFREERAIVRLHELEERARHFHRQVERHRQNFSHTERDFRELRRAYARAAYARHDLHALRRIDREFDRLSDAMYDLEMYAEGLFGRGRPAHRRYRDRDDDSDSDSDWYRHRRHGSRARIVLPRVRVSWDWLDD